MNQRTQSRLQMLTALGCPPWLAQQAATSRPKQQGRIEFRNQAGGEAELYLYDFIGYDWWSDSGISAAEFAQSLKDLGSPKRLTIRINSPGGDVWDGMSIFNMISQLPYETRTEIDGLAASIASVIALATDRVAAGEMSQLMIHDAWTATVGNEQQMRELADVLAKLDQQIAETYAKRSGKSAKYFRDLQDAETYLTAQEALDIGLVDEVIGTRKSGQNASRSKTSNRVRRQMQLDKLATARR